MRHRLAQLHQSGATDGQIPAWDDGTDRYVPVDPPASPTVPTKASDLTTAWVALTTTVGGVPDLIWTSDDELIYAEVPIP